MDCSHDGFRSFWSRYDRDEGVLMYFWICDDCTARLDVAHREPYRPSFDPHGNDPFVTTGLR